MVFEFDSIALSLLRTMQLARECDRREGLLLRQGKGWFQVGGAGHEATAVFGLFREPSDLIFPHYRDRALGLTVGMPLEELACFFFARDASVSRGRNMPGHYSWKAGGFFSITTPTATQCLPAVGAARGMKRDGVGVSICLLGDASTRQGEFFEAICAAVEEQLPVVFVVEDNGYGISSPTQNTTPRALGVLGPDHCTRVDGGDPHALFVAAQSAIGKARSGGGSTVLWAQLDRLGPHTSSDDERVYRSEEELAGRRDPITRLADSLLESGALSPADWSAYQTETAETVRAAYAAAEKLPPPSPETVFDELYGATPAPKPLPLALPQEPITMREAVNAILRAGLETHPKLTIHGEDIADPKGGVFGMTKGLSRDYPERVTNSPLAEASIVGTAVGLAVAGHLPVFEIQFIDFLGPAFNQLSAQLANLRWRSGGEWSCPVVLYAPCGAYLPGGGMWHSQTNEGLLANLPGLRIVMPSTPSDAAGAFWTAFSLPDPTIILLPKHLLHARQSVPSWKPVPVGGAECLCEGSDVTLVAWGNTVEVAVEAAEAVASEGISVEVLDLRWLIPWDRDAVVRSVAKTGRLVVVQEDTVTASIGQAILSEIVGSAESFYTLAAAPRLLSRPDIPMPFSPTVELAILPSVAAVQTALREVVSG